MGEAMKPGEGERNLLRAAYELDQPLTDEELEALDIGAKFTRERALDRRLVIPSETVLRLVAEVRNHRRAWAMEVKADERLMAEVERLRALATCEACAAGFRRTDDGLHYDDAHDGATWGMCRSVVAGFERAELLRLRAEIQRRDDAALRAMSSDEARKYGL